ncbi:beta strand repeat-containing protein [Brucella anthropi]|uniref:beta strand repeat-containing protein n=1 Tax=Brucella anthropi TaxID=529 RepID=UPI002360A950|nr:hypothetical protein [Brucella anthropi]
MTNIYRVVGSSGGGALVGRDGYANTLVGTDGDTSFSVHGGTDYLYGGKGNNVYSVTDAVVTIHADGLSNKATVSNGLLTYYGSESGNDTIADTLGVNGGKTTVYAGKGSLDITFNTLSYNEIYAGGGGKLTVHSGNSYNHMFLDSQTSTTLDYSGYTYAGFKANLASGVIINNSGASDTIARGYIDNLIGTQSGSGIYDAKGYQHDLNITAFYGSNTINMGDGDKNSVSVMQASGRNIIDVGSGKNNTITIYGGDSNKITANHVNVQNDVHIVGSSNSNIIDIEKSATNNIDFSNDSNSNSFTFGAGTKNNSVNILGKGSNNTFKAGVGTDHNVFHITGTGSNNTFTILGGAHNEIYVDGGGTNNKVDYSATTGQMKIDLVNDKADLNGSGGHDEYKGITYIVGNKAVGNTYTSKDGVNTTFDIRLGTHAVVTAANNASNHYMVTANHNDTIVYTDVNTSATFTLAKTGGTVTKGSYTDTISDGYFNKILGTNHGDTFKIGAGMNNLEIDAGSGDDVFLLDTTWGVKGSIFNGGQGNNTFTYYDTSTNAFTVKITGSQGDHFNFTGGYGSSGANGQFQANDFNSLTLSGSNVNTVDWGGVARSGVHIAIATHGSSNTNTFLVVGGGNVIDGGIGATVTSYSYVNYSYYSSANNTNINVNLQTGSVHFSDNRADDTLHNINAIAGSGGDDTIVGHTSMNDIFYESGGSDHIDGGGGTGNIYKATLGHVVANFDSGTIGKFDDNGVAIGTDTISHIQQFDSMHNVGTTEITASSSFSMTFNLSGGGSYHFFGAQHYADTINVSGSSHLDLDYTHVNDNITVSLGSDANGRLTNVTKGGGIHDVVHGGITSIETSVGNDTFNFTKLADLNGIQIDGGGGSNTLHLNSGGEADLNLGGLSNVKHISTIDLTATQHNSISFDMDQFFAHNDESAVTMKINYGDSTRLNLTYDHTHWTLDQSVAGHDVYTNSTTHNTFTVDHPIAPPPAQAA